MKVIVGIIIVALVIGGVFLVTGHSPFANSSVNNTTPTDGGNSTTQTGEPPVDRTWVSPGKVTVDNFYAGAEADYPITIHNGGDTPATFAVSYRIPDNTATGYSRAPSEAQDWVIIADSTPVLAPKETKDIMITLVMPAGANIDSNKWEFWISAIDISQTGTVKTELCVRWLVNMR